MSRNFNLYVWSCLAAWSIAVAVLVLAYVAIALVTCNPWPWFEIVHESGDRTLIGTIFYFEHAAGELPLDFLLGAAVGSSAILVFPASVPSYANRWRAMGLGVAGTGAVIIAGTLWTRGLDTLYTNLLQMHTRPGEPLMWGAHWRYHLLSHASLMLISLGLAGVFVLLGKGQFGNGQGKSIFWSVVAVFLGLTMVFSPKWDSFTDPIFIGHQAREVFTHILVSVPAAWGVCLLLVKGAWDKKQTGTYSVRGLLIAGFAGLLVALFLLIAALVTSASSKGQTDSLVLLIFPHFFEHTLSYLVVSLTAGFVFDRAASRSGFKSVPRCAYS